MFFFSVLYEHCALDLGARLLPISEETQIISRDKKTFRKKQVHFTKAPYIFFV